MTKNPFLNALAAAAYITLVAAAVFYVPNSFDASPGIIAPITFLSLFVLSAALMGFFFLYQPLQFLLESKPREATRLFLMTIGSFVCITAVLVSIGLLLSGGL